MDLPIKISLPESFLEEEVCCDYTVSTKMKAIWAVELDLYKELDRVCKKYNLKLFGFAGTILGAVRHNGFIPWDDDMDFAMSREDYDILCKHAEDEFFPPYYWDSGCKQSIGSKGHGQLKNSLTTCIAKEENNKLCDFNQGIFIDVFPYDNVPDNRDERLAFIKRMQMIYIKRNRYKDYYLGKNNSHGFKRIIKKLYLPIFRMMNKKYNNKYYEEYERNKGTFNDTDTQYCVFLQLIFENNIERLIYRKSLFEDIVECKFEGTTIMIPLLSDKYLDKVYGNWKEFIKGDTIHGVVFFDPFKSYEYYLNHREEIIFD